jgi:hypothetical protein
MRDDTLGLRHITALELPIPFLSISIVAATLPAFDRGISGE